VRWIIPLAAYLIARLYIDRRIMADLTRLTAAVQTLAANVDKLPPAGPDQQPAIDDLTTQVSTINDKVVAALPTA